MLKIVKNGMAGKNHPALATCWKLTLVAPRCGERVSCRVARRDGDCFKKYIFIQFSCLVSILSLCNRSIC
ncbi:hypothetical protein HanRHA438_Chr03g0133411 [Helianthus annuus]|nr:hypothetical protein HanOQP8_Chr03g0113841 [Helianthus annuus]KAJ0936638.1 hypothetical protein HanRHA438_Chr03g0133411 [Helianthus annuus]